MGRKQLKMKKDILDEACKNSEAITDIMQSIDALIPPEGKEEAEKLWADLQQRMFYQDYLYNSHGSLRRPVRNFLKYDDYVRCLRKVKWC